MTTFFRSLVPSLLTGLFVACLGLAQVLPAQDPARQVIERAAGDIDGAIKKSVHDLKDPDSRIRQRALVQLGDLGPAAKPAVGAMIIALEDQHPDIRELAALALGELGPEAKDAIPALAERMKDREESVALAAVRSLARIGKPAVPSLVEALQGKDARIRSSAAQALGEIGPDAESAGPALIKAIKDKNPQVSISASSALGGIQTQKMRALLLAALRDKDPPTRAAVISALGRFRDEAEEVVPALDALLLDKDTMIRERAVQALGSIGSSRVDKFVQGAPGEAMKVNVQEIGPASRLVLDPLWRAWHDDSERIRGLAAQALLGVGPPAVPGLIQALEDPDRRMRLRVITILGIIRPNSKETLSVMIKSLGDPDGEVRNQAILTLQSMGPEATPAIAPLVAHWRRSNELDQHQAARALAAIGKAAVPPLLEVLQKEDDPSLRASAASALAWFGRLIEPTAIPALIAALRDKDERVRSAAAFTLAAHRPVTAKALPDLLKMLASDQNPRAAIDALAAMGPAAKAAVPSLIVLFQDRKQNTQVRTSAAFALSAIDPADRRVIPALVEGMQEVQTFFGFASACEGSLLQLGPVAVPALTAALADPQYKARGRVIAILARDGRASKDIIPILTRALNDEDPAARKQAGDSLGAMGPSALPTLLAAAKGNNPRAREAAFFGLFRQYPFPDEARKALLAGLQDENAEARIAAGIAIGGVANAKPNEWVPALVALVESGKSRDAAFRALWRIGPAAKDAVPALVAVLRSGNDPDRTASAAALVRIGGPAATALVVLLRDKDASVRRLAAETLGQIQLVSATIPGPAARVAIPTLVEALQGADVEFAKHAANILPRIGKEALPALFAAPRDKQGRFQARVALVIDGIAPTTEGLVPVLVAAMRDPDVQVRLLSAQALSRMGERVVPDLIAALKDPDAETRHLCGNALGLMGAAARAAVPALIEHAKSKTDRWWAADAVLRIDPKAAAAAGITEGN